MHLCAVSSMCVWYVECVCVCVCVVCGIYVCFVGVCVHRWGACV